MTQTTNQKLSTEDGMCLAYFIDNSAEVTRWSASDGSTEERPLVTVSVCADHIEVNLSEYHKA